MSHWAWRVWCKIFSLIFYQSSNTGELFFEYAIIEEAKSTLESKANKLEECWVLYVDGSSSAIRFEAGLILTSPEGAVMEYVLHFWFKVSNNETEYKALVTGLKIAKELGVWHLRVYSDSQLIVSQVRGEYEMRESNMVKYLEKIKDLTSDLASLNIQQILSFKNARLTSCQSSPPWELLISKGVCTLKF